MAYLAKHANLTYGPHYKTNKTYMSPIWGKAHVCWSQHHEVLRETIYLIKLELGSQCPRSCNHGNVGPWKHRRPKNTDLNKSVFCQQSV